MIGSTPNATSDISRELMVTFGDSTSLGNVSVRKEHMKEKYLKLIAGLYLSLTKSRVVYFIDFISNL